MAAKPQPLFDWATSTRPNPPAVGVVDAQDRKRLGGQNARLLERLERGPATGPELMQLVGAMNISARVSNVRAYLAGIGKTLHSERLEGGVWKYWIGKSE